MRHPASTDSDPQKADPGRSLPISVTETPYDLGKAALAHRAAFAAVLGAATAGPAATPSARRAARAGCRHRANRGSALYFLDPATGRPIGYLMDWGDSPEWVRLHPELGGSRP